MPPGHLKRHKKAPLGYACLDEIPDLLNRRGEEPQSQENGLTSFAACKGLLRSHASHLGTSSGPNFNIEVDFQFQ
jgi:hypothetical protein